MKTSLSRRAGISWAYGALAVRPIFGMMLLLLSTVSDASAQVRPNGIVTYDVANFGARRHDVAVTFGGIFARGDVPSGTSLEAADGNGHNVPLQLDRKATHPDHSLRHAVITLDIPNIQANTTIPIILRRTDVIERSGRPVALSDLPPNFDAVVTLRSKETPTKERRLTASARAFLTRTTPEKWLAGPEVSEWWVAGPFADEHGAADPHLYVQFGIRCYGRDRPLRVEVNVENDWTFVPHPRTEFYDAQVSLGGKTVFAKIGMIHSSHTRWRKGFWWNEPVAAYVRQNLSYLKKARVIPNYDPNLVVSQSAVGDAYRDFEASDRGPMAAGILMKYMPTTGGRPDIAPLPQWQAIYLLTMDPRMYQVSLQTADLGASFSSHYRNERTGRPVTLEDYPNISTHSNFVGKPRQLELPDTRGYTDSLVPDAAHEPALDFVPYLVTGDRFYLEELEFWSQWNETGTAPGYHGFGKALVSWDQVRAQAWSLRTLAQAEYIAPDFDPLKPVLLRELQANIRWYNEDFLDGPDKNRLGLLWQKRSSSDYGRDVAPWQDDFFTWALGYVQSLGDINASRLLRWKSAFVVGRMVAPGFCWILATPYTMRLRDSPSSEIYPDFPHVYQATLAAELPARANPVDVPCASTQMAHELGLLNAGEMIGNAAATDGYPAQLQPALAAAVDSGEPRAKDAWRLFLARGVKPNFATEPAWDIVPWP